MSANSERASGVCPRHAASYMNLHPPPDVTWDKFLIPRQASIRRLLAGWISLLFFSPVVVCSIDP